MMERYKKSLAYLDRALKVTPGGAQTMSKMAARFSQGAYPVALTKGHGATVTDVDGNEYMDFICGLACMTLGYGHGGVEDAVQRQLAQGVSFSLPHYREADLAERLCDLIPCAEMVRFVKTGSEATEAAIRTARRATGRDLILTVGDGYHGWHSWFQSVKPYHPGIPEAYTTLIQSFPYGDILALEEKLEQHGNTAAIIMEPCLHQVVDLLYLQQVRALCTKHKIILIWDEMVTGFRWANGGAQQYFNVMPDLACFGKACANGFPLAFLCGRRDLMTYADLVSGTFGGEALSIAACHAVLNAYATEDVIKTLWALGDQFATGVDQAILISGLPAKRLGYAVKPLIQFTEEPILCTTKFIEILATLGILWHPGGSNISAAMSRQDIDMAIAAVHVAMATVKDCLATKEWNLKGQPIQAALTVRAEVKA